jgi:hypothetical protein
MERFNLKNLNEIEVEECYHVEVSNRWKLTVPGKLLERI